MDRTTAYATLTICAGLVLVAIILSLGTVGAFGHPSGEACETLRLLLSALTGALSLHGAQQAIKAVTQSSAGNPPAATAAIEPQQEN